jgi:hypothetical protein
MPQDLNPPLRPIGWDRDPFLTPLSRVPPRFTPSEKITTERIEGLNFGSEGWLSEEEFHLLADVVKLREKVLAFGPEERGLLKREIGQPYKIPTIPHEPWQIRPIPIPAAIQGAFMELVKERVRTGLYEQTNSS